MKLVIGTERALADEWPATHTTWPGPGGAVSCIIGSLRGDRLP